MSNIPQQEPVYTTGQVAKLLGVAPRTVSKWIDEGSMKGYRLPSTSRYSPRRVTRTAITTFCLENKIPIPKYLSEENE